VRPHIGAALAAGLADKPWLNVGKSHIVRPSVGRQLNGVTAPIVSAIDQNASRTAAGAHLAEGDFHGTHCP
jgi:hypothetical protein